MTRVLQRPPSSHIGKLDGGTPDAAMIVVMFYSLYRYKPAEELRDLINLKLRSADAMDSLEPVTLPFMTNSDKALPVEVVEALVEALQIQLGYDISKKKVKADDPTIKAMENKLRSCIARNRDELLSRAVSLETSREAFIEQVVARVLSADSLDDTETKGKKIIKLASIDVPRKHVHQIVKDQAHADTVSELLKMCMNGQDADSCWKTDHYQGELFVPNTHVTMLFWLETTQDEIREKFGALLGAKVNMQATALLWDDSVVALEVNIAETTVDGQKIPPSKNEFVHITVWVAKNSKASMSNRLPDKVREGTAKKVELMTPVCLTGTISFWDLTNKPIPKEAI